MKMCKTILAIVTFVVFASGCALTQTQKQVNYVPSVDSSAIEGLSGAQVSVGDFTDNRGVENPALIFHKKNMYNNTMSGAYLAQKPLVEYIKEGVIASLHQGGALVESGSLVLRASLEDFDDELIMGFWSSKMRTKMTVKFSLWRGIDQVWNDTIIGKAMIEKGDFLQQAVTTTTDNVVKELMNHKEFKAALKEPQP